MQTGNRRKFVTTVAMAAGAACAGLHWHAARAPHCGKIRLLPVDGIHYTESFLRFVHRARFDSVHDAISSIRDRSLPIHLVYEPVV